MVSMLNGTGDRTVGHQLTGHSSKFNASNLLVNLGPPPQDVTGHGDRATSNTDPVSYGACSSAAAAGDRREAQQSWVFAF